MELNINGKTRVLLVLGDLKPKPLFATKVTDIPENHIISVAALNVTTELVEEVEE